MSCLVLILLFLSTLHAYDARHLGFHTENFALIKLKASPLDTQDVKKTWLLDISSSTLQAERISDKNRSDQKMSSSEIDQQEEIKIEGAKRLMMEDASNETEKMVNNSEENEVGEDMVVMDYAQPHRKPPIHNEKP